MSRAVSPVIAVVLLVVVTVGLAGGFAVAATDAVPAPAATESATATPVSLALDADRSGRVTLEHRGGAPLDARDLDLRVTVDGQELRHQPPIPFFAAAGFHGGPTGPFNDATDPEWTVGETASFQVASTNEPDFLPGRTLAIAVYEGDARVATATTRIDG